MPDEDGSSVYKQLSKATGSSHVPKQRAVVEAVDVLRFSRRIKGFCVDEVRDLKLRLVSHDAYDMF